MLYYNDSVLAPSHDEDRARKNTTVKNRHNDLQPLDAIETLLQVMEYYPLVALAEIPQLQEFHEYLMALLYHPYLSERITDIVVEFGNAHYQKIADRFVLTDQPVSRSDLQLIWKTTSENSLWNAQVCEQFLYIVRAINWSLHPSQRLRVLLGSPPVHAETHKGEVSQAWFYHNAHYVRIVEKEVLQKGRRALLIASRDRLLRGQQIARRPQELNVGGLLANRHPGSLFVADLLALSSQNALVQKAGLAKWPRLSFAFLVNTWLAHELYPDPLGMNEEKSPYGTQADAILYLGPGEMLTTLPSDPSPHLAW
jgi:hypothetical protein